MSDAAADEQAPPDELVRLFIDEATRSLTSLPVVPPLRCTTKVLHYGENGWEDGSSVLITSWFDVTVAFSSEAIEGAYRFGERENAVWAFARKVGGVEPFALHEWAAALGRDPVPVTGGEWVYRPDRLRAMIAAFSDGLRDMHGGIAHSSDSVIARLTANRAARASEDAERARLRDQERDEVEAAEAFRRGDFASAVRLLQKHGTSLGAAQRRKLEIAESKLRSIQ
jgi:hypothetical protein